MMYTHVCELPTQVKAALNAEDQQKWMDAFNTEGLDYPARAWRAGWTAVMGSPNIRLMGGIASREVIDSQNEKVSAKQLVYEIGDAILSPGLSIHDIHSNRPCGVWFDASLEHGKDKIDQVRVLGAVYKGEPFFDDFWGRIVTKNLKELSVGIMKIDPQVECEGEVCWRRINKMQVFEISPVPRGACPGTVIDMVNFSAKGEEVMEEKKAEAPTAQVANKDVLSTALGDLGIEALQRVLTICADTNKKLDALIAQINKPAVADPEEMGEEQKPGEEKPGEEHKPGEEKKEGDEKVPEKKEKETSDKAISPPMAPTEPVAKDTIAAPENKCPCSNKAEETAKVNELKDKAEMAKEEGATTPRPPTAPADQGVSPKGDALKELLSSPEKIRGMTIQDLDKFAEKYTKGEI